MDLTSRGPRRHSVVVVSSTGVEEDVDGAVDVVVLVDGDDVDDDVGVDVSGGSAMMKILDGLTRLTRPANYLGLPALSLPIGMSRSGTPFSGQLIAPPWCEARLCRVGAAFQGASSWHRMAPPLGQAVAAHPNPKKGTP